MLLQGEGEGVKDVKEGLPNYELWCWEVFLGR